MEYRSYNKELAYSNMLFKRLFSNIAIERDGKLVKFNCVLGTRSRIFKNLENPQKKAMYKLPMIIIQRTGISKNDERLANVWNEVKYRTHSSRLNYNIFTPVPIDLTYDVTFVSKYPGDIDMAMSNIIPFFNKDLYVSSQHPKFADISFTSQVVMENSITEDHPDEIDGATYDIDTATCSFTYKTFIFCGNRQAQPRTIITSMISTYLSSVEYSGLSDIVKTYSFEDFFKKFNEINKTKDISCIVSEHVETTIQVPVSVEVSAEISVIDDPFTAPIGNINIGFYATPTLSSHTAFMDHVDQLSASGINDAPYVDRFIYRFNDLSTDTEWVRYPNVNEPPYPHFD